MKQESETGLSEPGFPGLWCECRSAGRFVMVNETLVPSTVQSLHLISKRSVSYAQHLRIAISSSNLNSVIIF